MKVTLSLHYLGYACFSLPSSSISLSLFFSLSIRHPFLSLLLSHLSFSFPSLSLALYLIPPCRQADRQLGINFSHACMHPSKHPCTHPSKHPCIHPCIRASTHPSMHPSIHPCIHQCIQCNWNVADFVDTVWGSRFC